jgi:hypothetical protein
MMEGVNSSMIYLIYKTFCKCYNVPTPSTIIKKWGGGQVLGKGHRREHSRQHEHCLIDNTGLLSTALWLKLMLERLGKSDYRMS